MGDTRDDVESMIAEELRSHHQKTGAWVKAMAHAEGDFDRARKRYRELRLAELCAERKGDPLQRVREELRHELERHDRSTVYRALSIAPDAGDDEVAAVIAGLLTRGDTLDAEARYAVEVLGDAARRADYDHKLLAQLRTPGPLQHVVPAVDARAVPRAPVAARRSLRELWLGLGAVLAVLTYFGTEHYRELRRQEIESELADRRAAVAMAQRQAKLRHDGAQAVPAVVVQTSVGM